MAEFLFLEVIVISSVPIEHMRCCDSGSLMLATFWFELVDMRGEKVGHDRWQFWQWQALMCRYQFYIRSLDTSAAKSSYTRIATWLYQDCGIPRH